MKKYTKVLRTKTVVFKFNFKLWYYSIQFFAKKQLMLTY